MWVFAGRIISFFTSLVMVVSSFLGVECNLFEKQADDFRVTTYIRGDAVMYWGGILHE